jgi:hypothetical protein
MDLVVTLQKPAKALSQQREEKLQQADARSLIDRALKAIPETMRTPSHVYAAIIRDAIKLHQMVDHLHLSDVLVALRAAGYNVNRKTGVLTTRAAPLVQAAE